MLTKAIGMVTRAAWVSWLVIGLVALVATYAVDPASLPAGTPHMRRVTLGGAQDSSAAALALVRFKEVGAFGRRWPLEGGMQLVPVPGWLGVLLALLFVDVSVRGPRVIRHREA